MNAPVRAAAPACVAGGGALAVATGGMAWLRTASAPAPGLPSLPETLTGSQVAAPVVALGLAALAAAASLLALRGAAARLVGALAVLLGTATVAGAWAGAHDEPAAATVLARTPWPWAAVAAGVLIVAGGVLGLVYGGTWPGLSRRHDLPGRQPERPPGRGPAPGPAAAWDALDRGEDPTRRAG